MASSVSLCNLRPAGQALSPQGATTWSSLLSLPVCPHPGPGLLNNMSPAWGHFVEAGAQGGVGRGLPQDFQVSVCLFREARNPDPSSGRRRSPPSLQTPRRPHGPFRATGSQTENIICPLASTFLGCRKRRTEHSCLRGGGGEWLGHDVGPSPRVKKHRGSPGGARGSPPMGSSALWHKFLRWVDAGPA